MSEFRKKVLNFSDFCVIIYCVRPDRLLDRTPAFHVGKRGSIPRRAKEYAPSVSIAEAEVIYPKETSLRQPIRSFTCLYSSLWLNTHKPYTYVLERWPDPPREPK